MQAGTVGTLNYLETTDPEIILTTHLATSDQARSSTPGDIGEGLDDLSIEQAIALALVGPELRNRDLGHHLIAGKARDEQRPLPRRVVRHRTATEAEFFNAARILGCSERTDIGKVRRLNQTIGGIDRRGIGRLPYCATRAVVVGADDHGRRDGNTDDDQQRSHGGRNSTSHRALTRPGLDGLYRAG